MTLNENEAIMAVFEDVFYPSADGRLTLYARDYGAPKPGAMAVLCLHGLTRNSADFEWIAGHLRSKYHAGRKSKSC